jgi:hypothetical protein
VAFSERGRQELDSHPGLSLDAQRFLVRSLTQPGDTILDIFGGVGTTSLAALVEGRHAVYFEENEASAALASTRVSLFFSGEGEKAHAKGLVPGAPSTSLIEDYMKGSFQKRAGPIEKDVVEFLDVTARADFSYQHQKRWSQKVPDFSTAREVLKAFFLSMTVRDFNAIKNMSGEDLERYIKMLDWDMIKDTCGSATTAAPAAPSSAAPAGPSSAAPAAPSSAAPAAPPSAAAPAAPPSAAAPAATATASASEKSMTGDKKV